MNNLLNLLVLSTASASSMRRNSKSQKPTRVSNYRNDGTINTNTNTNTNPNANANINANANANTINSSMMNNFMMNNTMMTMENTLPTPDTPVFTPEVDALLPNNLKGRFTLPPLPYSYDALEPYIDTATMRAHHNQHHQNYVNNLNLAISRYPELYAYTLGQLLAYAADLPSDVQSAILNNGGGHYNHSFFWNTLSPNGGGEPTGAIGEAINRDFGSYSNFKRAFTAAALSVFGSGYAWLVLPASGRLEIITTRNQETPIARNLIPLLTLDVWEHAYYLKNNSYRDRYIEDWFNVINWPYVNSIYEAAIASNANANMNNTTNNNSNNNNSNNNGTM